MVHVVENGRLNLQRLLGLFLGRQQLFLVLHPFAENNLDLLLHLAFEVFIEQLEFFFLLPELDQVFRAGHQFAGVDGLGQVIVGAYFEAFDLHLLRCPRRHQHDGDVVEFRIGLDDPAQRGAIHLGHHHVANDQVRLALVGFFEAFLAVLGGFDAVCTAQDRGHVLAHLGVVLHHENQRGLRRERQLGSARGRRPGLGHKAQRRKRQLGHGAQLRLERLLVGRH